MFQPHEIPALAKTHELISNHERVDFATPDGRIWSAHLRGYGFITEDLSCAEVVVSDDFCENKFSLGFLVSLVSQGLMAKHRDRPDERVRNSVSALRVVALKQI